MRGLNYLLNQQTNEALGIFIDAFAANAKAFDAHMAMGGLFRRRGETDKAIQIHQNLMSHHGLSIEQAMVAKLELAHDFIKAGLLNRAELSHAMSHYCCELALESWHQHDINMVHSYLSKAIQYDNCNPRIQLQQAELCISERNYKSAVRYLESNQFRYSTVISSDRAHATLL